MNSLKKALASLFVLATIFVVFSCSNASDSGEKSDGNPFKGTRWEGDEMSLKFVDSDTCVYSTSSASFATFARAASATQTIDYNCTYTWEMDDDGNYTATLNLYGSFFATFTIDASGSTSGTFFINGKEFTFSKKAGSDIEISTEGDGYPFAGTKWVYVDEDGDEDELSFDKTTAYPSGIANGVLYTSKQESDGSYTATMELLGTVLYTFTIKSDDADKGVLHEPGLDLTYRRKK